MSKLYNIIQNGLFIFSILITFYFALPVEYQQMIPQVNQLTVGITALGGTSLGTVMATFQQKFKKLSKENETKIDLLAQGFVNVIEKISAIEKTITQDVKERQETNGLIHNNNIKNEELQKLLNVLLQAKANNVLIDEATQKLIEEALNGKEKEL